MVQISAVRVSLRARFQFMGILCILACSSLGWAKPDSRVLEASHFDALYEIVMSEVDEGSLVLFDVDDVLMAPTEDFDFRSRVRKDLKKDLSKKYTEEEIQSLFADFFRKRRVRLVSTKMPLLLSVLSEQKTPTAALSAWWTGAFGSIEKMEALRIEGLAQLGLSFGEMFPFEDRRFDNYVTEEGRVPMILSGVIITALADKGDVLAMALDSHDLRTQKIIFIDDQLTYLAQVAECCRERGLDFIGIHYTEASQIPLPELDLEKEIYRFAVLEKEGIWLLD